MADFDSMVDDGTGAPNAIPQAPQVASSDIGDFDSLTDDGDKYGTLGQQALAGVEGIAHGVAGPLATAAEKHILGVPEEDILGRQEANPITHGVGQVAGLVGGAMLAPEASMAGLMSKAGAGAAEAALPAISALATEGSLLHKVGSAAVAAAAENAVLTGSDEVSKMILNDPETSAESAIANVGMAAALGGAGGAFITGAVSPLWSATAGPGLDRALSAVRSRMNGEALIKAPQAVEEALTKLSIDATPLQRAAVSESNTAIKSVSALRRAENQEMLENIHGIQQQSAESVANSLGTDLEAVRHYDKNDAGHALSETWSKEYDALYGPLEEQAAARKAAADPIAVADEAKLTKYGNILETGMEKVGTDSPYYKLYEDYGNRLLAQDTIGKIDNLRTEIGKRIKGLRIGGDYNEIDALSHIRSMLGDFQEAQISGTLKNEAVSHLDSVVEQNAFSRRLKAEATQEGLAEGKSKGADLLNQRADFNRNYREFAKMSEELTDHLGVGKFHGAGTLEGKLTKAIAPEDLLKKFSIKGNYDFAPFLEKNFPETYKAVLENERKEFLKQAVQQADKKGQFPIDIRSLSEKINKAQAGEAKYLRTILPQEAIDKVEAARIVQNAVTSPRDSGTPAGIAQLFGHIPGSVMAGVAMLGSHNPTMSLLVGELSAYAGKTIPESGRLALLKFLASDQPVKAEGFKAMIDFMHNTYKGENMIAKSVKDVFKAGAQVLVASNMPAKADRDKLDKIVTKLQDAPDKVYALQNGHVGHYLSAHQAGLTEASTRALGYLQSLKPRPFRASPLDAEVPPGKSEVARYNRALDIAQQPAIVMKHIKDGTLQHTDMQDLGAMYPGLYKNMAAKLTNEMTDAVSRGEHIPYKTRMSMSLFLGQPLDTTMAPVSIQAAQMAYLPKPNEGAQGAQPKSGSSAKMGKNIKSYQTPLQASEARRMNHK